MAAWVVEAKPVALGAKIKSEVPHVFNDVDDDNDNADAETKMRHRRRQQGNWQRWRRRQHRQNDDDVEAGDDDSEKSKTNVKKKCAESPETGFSTVSQLHPRFSEQTTIQSSAFFETHESITFNSRLALKLCKFSHETLWRPAFGWFHTFDVSIAKIIFHPVCTVWATCNSCFRSFEAKITWPKNFLARMFCGQKWFQPKIFWSTIF